MKIRRPVPDMRPDRDTVLALITPQLVTTDRGCWEWRGWCDKLGYGHLNWKGFSWPLHRLMYACTHGAFDPQLDVLHSCDNPPCCNPAHLRLGDMFDNQQERVAKGRHYLTQRTLCPRGHPLYGENLYTAPNGKRACKTCQRAIGRIKAGWPEDLAWNLGPQPLGTRPVNAPRKLKLRERVERPPRTRCKNGHELAGDAVYATPAGNVECKICRRAAALRWLKAKGQLRT